MTVRRWRFGLTADEWLHLAAEAEDSEVAPCCANLSALREALNQLATTQASGDGFTVTLIGQRVALAYRWCVDGHDGIDDPRQFPLLHRVLDGLVRDCDVHIPEWDHDDPDPKAARREE